MISNTLVDNIENKLPKDIEYINNNREVKANIIS
jgi:hypothetical protein